MSSPSTDREGPDAASGAGHSTLYTGTGDRGTTALGDRSRTEKADLRVAARGDCEEAGALLGLAVTLAAAPSDEMVLLLTRLENDLLDVGADIGAPVAGADTHDRMRIGEEYVRRLESACEHFGAEFAEPASVVLPGGTTLAAVLHIAHATTRRAERTTHTALAHYDDMNPLTSKYLNRLGSLLFILARAANAEHGDIAWHPGMTSQLGETELWEPLPEPNGSSGPANGV